MTLRPINETFTSNSKAKNLLSSSNDNQQNLNNSPSFQGFNPVTMLMDGIDRGGFAASFISQDFVGMAMPRVLKGMNRGRDIDENGEKIGPYNWAFARKEGVREILSGPSAFIIPAGILAVVKKYFGASNNVPVDMIEGLSKIFDKFATEDLANLNVEKNMIAKQSFYERVFKNVLKSSTIGMDELAIKKAAKDFANQVISIESAKPKSMIKNLLNIHVAGSKQDLINKLEDDYMAIRKQFAAPSSYNTDIQLSVEGKNPVKSSIKTLLNNLKDFTNDALDVIPKQMKGNNESNVSDLVKNFVSKRTGSRILTNFAMFAAVVEFYNIIPKLYNLGLKENPALKASSESETIVSKEKKTQPTFTGKASIVEKAGKKITNTPWLKNLSDKFEFDGASMSIPAMLTLLFAFCLPPRFRNAQDKYDRKEILLRDIASFAAILFAAKGLSRGFSVLFSKISGLALNIKPDNFHKSFFEKVKGYLSPGDGIQIIKSDVLKTKYSNIDKYQDGINGFFKFIEENGGNIKKVLMLDKDVYKNANNIVGKDLKVATVDEIKVAFQDIKDNDALENIYKVFRNTNNKYVKRSKTFNSSFDFASTILLVPAFMIWLARTCENMTLKQRAKDEALEVVNTSHHHRKSFVATKQPSMEGFLKK